MNSLEWINAEIEKTKNLLGIAQCNEVMFGDENNEVYKMLNNKLNHLFQIKTELEIMELIKNGRSSMETTLNGDQIMRFQNLKLDDWVKLWNKLEEILLKKALEVKDE